MREKARLTAKKNSKTAYCRAVFSCVLLWIISAVVQATVLTDIGQDSVQLTNFPIEYFTDTSQTLDYASVRQADFHDTMSTTTLGTGATVTWFRVRLHNTQQQDKE